MADNEQKTDSENKNIINAYEDKITKEIPKEVKIKLRKSLAIHIIIGMGVLGLVHTMNTIENNLPFLPKSFVPPLIVGMVSGYLIWKTKSKLIESNLHLEKLVEKRTFDLNVANQMLQEELAKIEKPKAKKEK